MRELGGTWLALAVLMLKQTGRFGLGSLVFLPGLAVLAAGCNSDEGTHKVDGASAITELRSDEPRLTPDVSQAKAASQGEREFAFSFLHALKAEENLAFSPHSLSTAFAMLTDAAEGNTLTEVAEVMHFGNTDDAFHTSQDALQLGLEARNREATVTESEKVDAQILAESNDVWIRDDAPPAPTYLDTLARYYGVGVHQADFGNQPELARVAINDKVSSDTHALIPELIPQGAIDELTVAVLTNALYFKAPWQARFADAVAGDFHRLDGSVAGAQMLKSQQGLAYYQGSGFVSVAVPYYGGDLEMLIVLPDAGAYDSVRAGLSSEGLSQIVSQRNSQLVLLTLPKFNVKSSVPAKATLEGLGMQEAFDEDLARFPKLVSPLFPQVYVSDVLHQATVAIDEKGTEASAATAIIVAGVTSAPVDPPMPKVVTVDRPFLFVIRDNPTGSVLFVGQVVAP